MKQIISFKKEVAFKTMIAEICSISLEHTLHFTTDATIEGNLIISGTYKMTEATTIEEPFHYSLPVDIMLTNELEEDGRKIAIDNFTYSIMNEELLELDVDILIKGLEKVDTTIEELEELNPQDTREGKEETTTQEEQEKEQPQETLIGEDELKDITESINNVSEQLKENVVKEQPIEQEEPPKKNDQQEKIENDKVMNSIFSAFENTEETYTTYSIYRLKEDDTLEQVLERYKITKEELANYNNLEHLEANMKLIIPATSQDTNA